MTVEKKIRILQLGSPAGLYGAERWILALVRHLDPARIESWVGVIKDAPEMNAPLCDEAEKIGAGIKIFEAYGRANFKAVSLVKKFILEHNIHILHTHFYKTDLIGLLATRGTHCKVMSTPHGWSREADFKLWSYEIFDRMIFPFFDAVVPLSDDLYNPLKKIPGLGKKLHLIRNGVDISEIDAVREIAPEIASWQAEGAFVLGYIGQLIGRKGLDVLLRAAASLPKTLNWRLAFIGEGDKRGELESLCKELGLEGRVTFFGFRKDRLAFLKGFDAFVLPSRLEGIPRCLMEAMAAGTTVIASDIPGCRDLIHNNQTGLLFECDNRLMLTETITKLAATPSLKADLAQNGKAYVIAHHSAARMAKEYETLFFNAVTK